MGIFQKCFFFFNGDLSSAIDGKSVKWYEPPPVVTALSQSDVFDPSISQLYEGSPGSLSWNYSLTSDLSIALVTIKFSRAIIATIKSNGQANDISADFKERFSIRSTTRSATLIISSVAAADDNAKGYFSCELITTTSEFWRREIQVEVIGKLTVQWLWSHGRSSSGLSLVNHAFRMVYFKSRFSKLLMRLGEGTPL